MVLIASHELIAITPVVNSGLISISPRPIDTSYSYIAIISLKAYSYACIANTSLAGIAS